MKKTILLFTIAMLMMGSTACSDNSNSPDSQPQSSTEKTSSADSAPESKSDSESSESISQTSTSEATSSTDPVSDNQSDTESPESTPETELEKFIKELDGYDCAVAYLGYYETKDASSVRECAGKSPAAAEYPFIADISDDRIILAGGGEIYCVIPANTDAKVTVNSLEYDENSIETNGDELYSGDNAPILISCNESDIMANVAVSITNGDKTLRFSPFISLRDGRLSLPEDMKILDFSEYDF